MDNIPLKTMSHIACFKTYFIVYLLLVICFLEKIKHSFEVLDFFISLLIFTGKIKTENAVLKEIKFSL